MLFMIVKIVGGFNNESFKIFFIVYKVRGFLVSEWMRFFFVDKC